MSGFVDRVNRLGRWLWRYRWYRYVGVRLGEYSAREFRWLAYLFATLGFMVGLVVAAWLIGVLNIPRGTP
ncbi:MAG: hypothetical protein M3N52_11890 [Actinomycetota bacterium]|nr:hypothetical protein [Actinomycetota bacterium]